MKDQEDGKAKNLPATTNRDIATQVSSNSLVSRGIADLAELGNDRDRSTENDSQTLTKMMAWIHGAAKKLLAINGRAPLITELAAEVGIDVEELNFTHKLFFADARHETCKRDFDQALRTLTYQEREILKLLYGWGEGYSYTHDEVAEIFQESSDEIQEYERSAMQGVLSYFADKPWDAMTLQPPDTPPAPRR